MVWMMGEVPSMAPRLISRSRMLSVSYHVQYHNPLGCLDSDLIPCLQLVMLGGRSYLAVLDGAM